MSTIVAVASPPGGAPRGIVRISGPQAFALAGTVVSVERIRRVFRGSLELPGRLLLPALTYAMPGPASYTGEDVVEIHLPGSPPVLRYLCEVLIERGARAAGPGEFTMRAYLNGRMDLVQAEAVQGLIAARDLDEARAARDRIEGELSAPLRRIERQVLDLCADVEASLDFAEEEIRIVSISEVSERIEAARGELAELVTESSRVEDGRPTVVLRGVPNVGKTLLFNRLTGSDAIVSDVAGTTRDLLEGEVDGIRILDSAGEQPAGGADRLAVELASRVAEEADLILLVLDATAPVEPRLPAGRPTVRVWNKADLLGDRSVPEGILVSALTGRGIDFLRSSLRDRLRSASKVGVRHRVTLRQQAHLREALSGLEAAHTAPAMELRALDLRRALAAIGAVTGREVNEELLTRIFEKFCVGK